MLLAPRIIADKNNRFGKPVIEGTRLPVDVVLGKLAGGMTYDEVRQEYAIGKDDILPYCTMLRSTWLKRK